MKRQKQHPAAAKFSRWGKFLQEGGKLKLCWHLFFVPGVLWALRPSGMHPVGKTDAQSKAEETIGQKMLLPHVWMF